MTEKGQVGCNQVRAAIALDIVCTELASPEFLLFGTELSRLLFLSAD